ncbi:hypothetical protein RRG08_035342 [Elysia crispata]|uniref:Uncharacterized protein n=1 Tax=Elysia crispata TaxID=231223 RepID=A0AAE0Y3B1_9GAST|nr:hypothetical protein RRG08_035342 [Elysia crispata]
MLTLIELTVLAIHGCSSVHGISNNTDSDVEDDEDDAQMGYSHPIAFRSYYQGSEIQPMKTDVSLSHSKCQFQNGGSVGPFLVIGLRDMNTEWAVHRPLSEWRSTLEESQG